VSLRAQRGNPAFLLDGFLDYFIWIASPPSCDGLAMTWKTFGNRYRRKKRESELAVTRTLQPDCPLLRAETYSLFLSIGQHP